MRMYRLLILLLFPGLTSFHNPSQKIRLNIELLGIKKPTGKILLAAYRQKDEFPEIHGKFKGLVVSAKSPNTEAFMEIPADIYAIAVFHDANNNGKLDTNMFGVPTEVYGFSNDARGTFSAPSFQSAAFELKSEKKVVITLK